MLDIGDLMMCDYIVIEEGMNASDPHEVAISQRQAAPESNACLCIGANQERDESLHIEIANAFILT